MTNCVFCPLLCELDANQLNECGRRRAFQSQLAERLQPCLPTIDGRRVSLEKAIEAAIERLSDANHLVVTGRVRSVETSRALLSLAAKFDAFVDMIGSEQAFGLIRAVQRSGMMTASLSEVRFRSDCVVIIGDDRILDSYPRLPEVLVKTSPKSGTLKYRHVLLMGRWSSGNLQRFRDVGCEVGAINVDVRQFPQSLHQWSRFADDPKRTTENVFSNWIAHAKYLTLAFCPGQLDFPQTDLWIERLFEWILQRNERHRCAAFPLSSDYGTFQQVCTWITGFPGRVFLNGTNFQYFPEPKTSARKANSIALTIDESSDNTLVSVLPSTVATDHEIWIGPQPPLATNRSMIFIPSALAGIDHTATFFRVDATVAIEAWDRHEQIEGVDRALALHTILNRIAQGEPC